MLKFKHLACGSDNVTQYNYGYDGKKLKPVLYAKKSADENIGETFCKHLKNEIDKVWTSEAKDMLVKEEDKANFETSTNCWICRKDFEEGEVRVRDHCHFTGKYRGAAHQKCNALFRKPRFVPVFFHNLSGYNAHLFIKNLNSMGEGNINCIPNTEEKYISFSKSIQDEEGKLKYKLRFLDSYKFMASSLDKLVNNLKPEQFENVKKHFDINFDMLLRKGVFPYDWFNPLEKLDEKQLPPKEAFHSKLNNSNITDDDFEHARKVWDNFKIKTFREYHDLYMKLDVLLLTDVFEIFRSVCLKNYGLDPCWYFTAPGLAWDACSKKTDVKLELMNDVDVLLMFEKGIRGGVSMIPK